MIKKIFYYGLIILTCALTFSIAATNIIWLSLLFFWIILVILKKKKIKYNVLYLPLGMFFIFSIISSIQGVNPANSFKGLASEGLFLFFIMFFNNLEDEVQLKKILYYFFLFSLLVSIFGLLQYIIGIDFRYGKMISCPQSLADLPKNVLNFLGLWDGRVVSTRTHPLTFAEQLVISLSLGLSLLFFSKINRKGKIFLGVCCLIMGIVLVFTFSRGPWLSLFLTLIFIEILKPQKTKHQIIFSLILFFSVAIAISYLMPSARRSIKERITNFSDPVRIEMWKSGANIIFDYPLLGVGINNVPDVYPSYKTAQSPEEIPHLHNNYLQLAAERGIICLGLFLWIFIVYFVEVFRKYKRASPLQKPLLLGCAAGVFSFLISGFTEYSYGDAEVVLLVYFLFALSTFLKTN